MNDMPVLLLFNEPKAVVEACLENAILRVAMIYPGSSHRIQSRLLTTWCDNLPDATQLSDVFSNVDISAVRCGLEIGYDPMFTKGRKVLPTEIAPLSEAAALGGALQASAVVWRPQNIVTQFKYFDDRVDSWTLGDTFPILATISFDVGDMGRINTRGLAWFAGQEIAFSSSHLSARESLRRIGRFADDILTNGPMTVDATFDGMQIDEKLDVRPSPDRTVLHVVARTVE
jgi:hypothetical protein